MAKKILIVDDNEDTCKIFAASLGKEGYEVAVTKDGDEALRMVAWVQPDLILLDIMMPRIDGLRVCRTLKKNSCYHSIPVFMISAKFGDPTFREQALDAGADTLLSKPIELPYLLTLLRNHFNKTKISE
ncbi:MAG: response regulator [Nitrospirae bacterium]|nr:response regulator [Candidatus Manganitrophaceae bacterium]